MNIFKILSSGDGSIKEPNISAFLGYLLDPNKEHGLKDYLLKLVLKKLNQNNDLTNLILNENIVNLTNDSDFKVEVELEKKVTINSGSKNDIDIVIKISKDNKLVFILCIENKIRTKSATENQLIKQLEGIRNEKIEGMEEIINTNNIGFAYLTPTPCHKCEDEYKKFKDSNNIPSIHLSWTQDIYESLVDMLEEESKGKIEPIFEYSKYTIKAFMNFIETDFQSYKEEKSHINKKDTTKWSFNNIDNLSRAKLALNIITKYVNDNNCTTIEEIIKIFGSNSVMLENDAKAKDNNSNKKTYYTKDDELIQLSSSNDKIAVNSQIWTIEKLEVLRDVSKILGIKIEEVN
ncbi:MAG: PD-(D/E)XK nuclease family protein [Campylobacterota bacterium]|nr:PD-(D/E)XK nuclease family protein [Campylobacterota bacterium]